MMKLLSAMIALCSVASPVASSATSTTQSNYVRLDKAERLACIRASGFVRATVSPKTYGFSDQVGWDIRLVSGTYPQRHMKGARGQMLCAYQRATGRVETQDYSGW
jgi:Ni/Co efflux regulator RcnB